jgi:hypothetical protein
MGFFNIFWERKHWGGGGGVQYKCAWLCSLCLFKWEYPTTGLVILSVSVCAVFHTSLSLLFFDRIIFYMSDWAEVTAGVIVVHHIHPENLSTFIALYVAVTFFVSSKPSFHTVSKKFLETEFESLNYNIFSIFLIYHFKQISLAPSSLQQRREQLVHNCYTWTWPRDVTNTQTLSSPGRNWNSRYLKSDRGKQLINTALNFRSHRQWQLHGFNVIRPRNTHLHTS